MRRGRLISLVPPKELIPNLAPDCSFPKFLGGHGDWIVAYSDARQKYVRFLALGGNGSGG